MKKLICTILILSMAFISTVAYADPMPSPSPEQTDAYSGELISYGITGETVVRIQLRLRELGYFNYKPTGSFQNMTVEATKRFQQKQVDSQGQPIMSDGTVGAQSMGLLFSHRVQRADIAAKIPIGKQLSGQATLTGELMEWSAVKDMLVAGSGYTITDYNTGVTFMMVYTGGEGHAEVECRTARTRLRQTIWTAMPVYTSHPPLPTLHRCRTLSIRHRYIKPQEGIKKSRRIPTATCIKKASITNAIKMLLTISYH